MENNHEEKEKHEITWEDVNDLKEHKRRGRIDENPMVEQAQEKSSQP